MTVKHLRWGVPSEVAQARRRPVLQIWYYSSSVVRLLCLISLWQCCCSSQGNTVFNGNWKCALPEHGRMTYIERNSCLWSLIGPFLCKWGLQFLTVLLVQIALSWHFILCLTHLVRNGAALICCWSCTALVGQGKFQSYWSNFSPSCSLIRVNSEIGAPCWRLGGPVCGFSPAIPTMCVRVL